MSIYLLVLVGKKKPKFEGSPCSEINWFRIVLDESHKIKVS